MLRPLCTEVGRVRDLRDFSSSQRKKCGAENLRPDCLSVARVCVVSWLHGTREKSQTSCVNGAAGVCLKTESTSLQEVTTAHLKELLHWHTFLTHISYCERQAECVWARRKAPEMETTAKKKHQSETFGGSRMFGKYSKS